MSKWQVVGLIAASWVALSVITTLVYAVIRYRREMRRQREVDELEAMWALDREDA